MSFLEDQGTSILGCIPLLLPDKKVHLQSHLFVAIFGKNNQHRFLYKCWLMLLASFMNGVEIVYKRMSRVDKNEEP